MKCRPPCVPTSLPGFLPHLPVSAITCSVSHPLAWFLDGICGFRFGTRSGNGNGSTDLSDAILTRF
jgi:hypothetical protein